jgi:hypothetical protein
MKKISKSKLLAVLAVPMMVLGVSACAAPKDSFSAISKRGLATGPAVVIVDGGGGGGSSAINYTSTGYPSFYGTETHSCKKVMAFGTTGADTSITVSHDTGVKIYGSSTPTNVGSTNSIKLDCQAPFIDFSAVDSTRPSDVASDDIQIGTTYLFEVYRGSYRVFYATITKASSNGSYVTTYDRNGATESVTASSDSTIDPRKLGKVASGLYSGSYTIKQTMGYVWAHYTTTEKTAFIEYEVTATVSGSLLVDYTAPTVSGAGYSTGKAVADGAYVNEAVKVTASDANLSGIYYQYPTYSSYSFSNSATCLSGSAQGWYRFYAQDSVGNKSGVLSFFYDSVKPTTGVYSAGSAVASGSYISSSFSYSASDDGSGIAQIYCKTPVSGSYQAYASGTIVPSNAGDGWYYFYAVDKAGNASATSSVFLETANPVVKVYRNGKEVYAKAASSSGTLDGGLYFNEGDTIKVTCDTPSGKVSSNMALGTDIALSAAAYPNDSYSVSLTSATGIAMSVPFRIVRSKPSISINGASYQSGATLYFSADETAEFVIDKAIADVKDTGATIAASGSKTSSAEIKYADAMSAALTTDAGTTTSYAIALSDVAGNQSSFTVVIDKEPATAQWKSGERILPDGGWSNEPALLEFGEAGAKATISKDGGEYVAYESGTEISADGTYRAVIVDLAGNKSEFSLHIDTVAPTGRIYAGYAEAQSGAVTNKAVYFTWDGDDATCLCNGSAYQKNTVITREGEYRFTLTDLAGNQTEYTITVDTTAPSADESALKGDKSLTVSRWYSAEYGSEKESFPNKQEASDWAFSKEFAAEVTVLTLNSVGDFDQKHLVADNGDPEDHSDEVRTGTYWLYKSEANPDTELYYFDESLLREAVAHYADKHVSGPYYLDNGAASDHGAESADMFDNEFTSDGVTAPAANHFKLTGSDAASAWAVDEAGKATSLEFGKELGEQLAASGAYDIHETDAAGNESSFKAVIDHDAPIISVEAQVFGDESAKKLTVTKDSLASVKAYYYKSFALSAIADADPWAVVSVSKDGETKRYTKGDALPTLATGGKYDIAAYDRLGNVTSFTVYIVGNPAAVAFTNNADDTAFDVDITLEQSFDTLVSLEITRNGQKLSGVSTDTLHYEFSKGGHYVVSMKDNFGRAITKEYDFAKALPEGTLTGVADGGKTAGDVGFTFDQTKFYAELRKDGALVGTYTGGAIQIPASEESSGAYEIKLVRTGDDENFRTYSFAIDRTAPDATLTGAANGGTTNGDVSIGWTSPDVASATVSVNGGEPEAATNGETFSKEGTYEVTVTDDMGNKTVLSFTIDKTVDYSAKASDGTDMSAGGTTSGWVAVTAGEPVEISVTKDGNAIGYSLGDKLTEEGTYVIRVTDACGNVKSFTVTIDKSVDFSMDCGDGSISNGDVTINAGEKVTATATKDGEPFDYKPGDAISGEGLYSVTLADQWGNSKTVTFRIVSSAKTAIDYQLGDGVGIVSATKDGQPFDISGNRILLTEDGTYKFVVSDNGEQFEFSLTLDTTAPEVTLNGVSDGGSADGAVTITGMTEEGSVQVFKDGALIDYELGDELKDYGSYRVVVTDALGNARTYTFTLAFRMNGWAIALIAVGVLSAAGVAVAIVRSKKKAFKK